MCELGKEDNFVVKFCDGMNSKKGNWDSNKSSRTWTHKYIIVSFEGKVHACVTFTRAGAAQVYFIHVVSWVDSRVIFRRMGFNERKGKLFLWGEVESP